MGLLCWSPPSFNLSSSLGSPFLMLHLESWGLTYPTLPHTSCECVLSGPSRGKTERTKVMRIYHIPLGPHYRVWFPFLRVWAVHGFPTAAAAIVAAVDTLRLFGCWCTTKCRKEKRSISLPLADHRETPCSLLELCLHRRPTAGVKQP